MLAKLFIAALFLSITTVALTADELKDKLQSAISNHETRLATQRVAIEQAFLSAIKRAANDEQLDELQSLLDARTAFMEVGELPEMPSMSAAKNEYIARRKESARLVYDVYQSAIKDLGGRALLDEAKQKSSDIARFINDERAAIGLAALPPAPGYVEEATESTSPESTQEFIEAFVAELSRELERIAKLNTAAQQDSEHRDLIKSLSGRIQRKQLSFRFPIQNVEESRSRGRYDLTFSAPLELTGLRAYRFSGGLSNQRLVESEALRLDEGYVCEVSGTGYMAVSGEFSLLRSDMPPQTSFVFSIETPWGSNTYSFYVMKYKVKIKKDASSTLGVEVE